MTEHSIKKPTLFISHATSDADFAVAVKQEIEKVFANGISVFCTSSPGAITVGMDWLSHIEQNLGLAQAVIAIVTPVSVERPWLWFEIGATWGKGRTGDCRIYPLCAPEIDLSDLPSPLDRLQALSMGKPADLKFLFEALIQQFGFGKISSFRVTNITKRIPRYKDVKVVEADLHEKRLYSGRYSGYSDEELMEVIDAEFIRPDDVKSHSALYVLNQDETGEQLVHNGKLIHYREVDRLLDLPTGTAKRLMNDVAARYGLKPVLERDNIVRYGPGRGRGLTRR
jgi:TIR domain